MQKYTPVCLSIAGFDPSGGAGLTADTKVFERLGVRGMSVCSGITVQTEDQFVKVNWASDELIQEQLRLLLRRYDISFVKIGLMENLESVDRVVNTVLDFNKNALIIWDPILKSSSGFKIMKSINTNTLDSILTKIFMVTPNQSEWEFINKATEIPCSVLLKGGHTLFTESIDRLIFPNGEELSLKETRIANDKHGTGCVLSAAILAFLSKGLSIEEACISGKNYVSEFISSDKTLLGWHYAE